MLLDAAVVVNDRQTGHLLEHINVTAKWVAILGLAFGLSTDNIRGLRAVPVIDGLQQRGAGVIAYDSVAVKKVCEQRPYVTYANSASVALDSAAAALFATDWDEFGALDEECNQMGESVVVNGWRTEVAKRVKYGGSLGDTRVAR